MKPFGLISRYCLTFTLVWCVLHGRAQGGINAKRTDHEDNSNIASHQSKANPLKTTSHSRQKRHIPDVLIKDKQVQQSKAKDRMQILNRLIKLTGSEGSCKCRRMRNSIDERSRLRERSKKSGGIHARGCTCDMMTTIRYMLKRIQKGGKYSQGDAFSKHVSQLDDNNKRTLRQLLIDEMRQLRRNEMLRRIRARRLKYKAFHRRRMLARDPTAVFRGKHFLSF